LISPSDFFADDDRADAASFSISGPAWRWRAADQTKTAAWYFLTIAGDVAGGIRAATRGRTGGFGSVRVTARIGDTSWQTSLFPSKELGGYLLPLKADVRRREGIDEGSVVTAVLML
jgi:Domain of unknown function (DUF1905)